MSYCICVYCEKDIVKKFCKVLWLSALASATIQISNERLAKQTQMHTNAVIQEKYIPNRNDFGIAKRQNTLGCRNGW